MSMSVDAGLTENARESHKKRKNGNHADDGGLSKKHKKNTEPNGRADSQKPILERTRNATTPNGASSSHPLNVVMPSSTTNAKSPLFHQTTSFYLPLSPISMKTPLEGLCAEHISPLILTYFPPLKGIVLSYSNARLSNHPTADEADDTPILAEAIDEYAASFSWLIADFLILRPERGAVIEGHITVQSESNLGLVCWNLFNANIARDQLPQDWAWVSGTQRPKKRKDKTNTKGAGSTASQGYYIDGSGEAAEGVVKFMVLDFDTLPAYGRDKTFLSIQGSLVGSNELGTGRSHRTGEQRRGSSSRSQQDHDRDARDDEEEGSGVAGVASIDASNQLASEGSDSDGEST